jgi:uncharacterized protein YndB with AHSA1/START domain
MSTSRTDTTTITVEPDMPAVRLQRDFDAPPALVFRAWADPGLVVRWLGPRDLEMEVERWDCRTGGAYRYVHRRGDDEFWFHGSFHEAREGERVVQTFTWEGAPDSVALETMTFTDLGDGRTRMESISLASSYEARDAMIASGMEHGIRDSFLRLDEVLAS